MKLSADGLKRPLAVIQFIFILFWASRLSATDSLYIAYALCTILSAICLYDNYCHFRKSCGLPLVINLTLASLLSFASILANYPVFQYIRKDVSGGTNFVLNTIAVISAFLGGVVVFLNFFSDFCKARNIIKHRLL